MKRIACIVFLLAAIAFAAYAQYVQRTLVKVAAIPGPMPNVYNVSGNLSNFLTKYYPTYIADSAFKVVTNNVVSYEVGLVQGRARKKLMYDQNSTFCKFGIDNVSLTIDQLTSNMSLPEPIPYPVPDYLKRQLPDYLVDKVFKVTSNTNVVTYEIGVYKGREHKTLLFSSSGRLLRDQIIR